MNMRIIYSLHTEPIIKGRWQKGNRLLETVKMFTLSLLYCNRWHSDITLYTDPLGEKLLRGLPTSMEILGSEQDEVFWIKGKMEAISLQNRPFIHFDGDVFLKKRIDLDFPKVLLERYEKEQFSKHYRGQLDEIAHLTRAFPWWGGVDYSFNCGVIGFRDMEIKEDFIRCYEVLLQKLTRNESLVKHLRMNWYEPCIVLEQYNLACLLNYRKISPRLLIAGDLLPAQHKNAVKLGYTHLFGERKYLPNIVAKIDSRLFTEFPKYYKIIMRNWKEYLEETKKRKSKCLMKEKLAIPSMTSL